MLRFDQDKLPLSAERFFSHVEKTKECWNWKAHTIINGYGQFKFNGKLVVAHRFSYELAKGPIPQGMFLDHLCRNKVCVNPAHLEPVTDTENKRRGKYGILKTECKRGHPLSGSNLIVNKKGYRICRTCKMRWARQWRAND